MALRRMPGVRVTALCDTVRPRAERLAKRHGIPHVFDNVDALCDERIADAVHVLVPPAAHFAVAKRCLERGLHVLVEKPMALVLRDVDELERVAKSQQLVLGVNHNQSANPAVVRVCDHIAAGRLERVLPTHTEETVGVHAVYPEQKHLSARVRLFIDLLVERLGPNPPWRAHAAADTGI
jgi:predicted dehydrogenase